MRPWLLTAAVLVLSASAALASRPHDGRLGGRPTAAAGADAVLAARAVGNAAAVVRLAARPQPDPWYVADELLARGEFEAALAFAEAGQRVDVGRLPAYVRAQRGRRPSEDAETRGRLRELGEALARGYPLAALALADECEAAPGTLSAVRVRLGRALALRDEGRHAGAVPEFEVTAKEAQALGWRYGEAWALLNGAHSAAWAADDDAAYRLAKRGLALAVEGDDHGGEARALRLLGTVALRQQRPAAAVDRLVGSLRIREARADRPGTAYGWYVLALAHEALGNDERAVGAVLAAAALWKELEQVPSAASALERVGKACSAHGAHLEAILCLDHALYLREGRDGPKAISGTVVSLGVAHRRLGDYPRALDCYEAAEGLCRRAGADDLLASVLGNIGNVHYWMGNLHKAVEFQTRALDLHRESGDQAGEALVLQGLGTTHSVLGQYSQALQCLERSLTLSRNLGHDRASASALSSLGSVHRTIGNLDLARRHLERALDLQRQVGDRHGAAATLGELGAVEVRLRLYEPALRHAEAARAELDALDDRPGVAIAHREIGRLHRLMGRPDEATRHARVALRGMEALGDRAGVAVVLCDLGLALHAAGDGRAGRRELRRAVREAQSLHADALLVNALNARARIDLADGRDEQALLLARQAIPHLEGALGGLADEEGASLRGKWGDLFAVGATAAARLGDAAECYFFLDSGRAGSLLESLDHRGLLRRTAVPEELRRVEAEAKARLARARWAYERARDAGVRDRARAAKVEREAARSGLQQVASRIQREVKERAGLYYPRAATLEETQKWLPADTALVVYGLGLDRGLALVATTREARLVDLGRVEDILRDCRSASVTGPGQDVEDALRRLAARIVEPLALDDRVRQVLVSPDGALAYVPFGALLSDRRVVCTPSGSTHVLLAEEERRGGEDVLALGDPVYPGDVSAPEDVAYLRGGRLTPLPATREEARTVGDVVLLGADATEERLRGALDSHARWRAVHFACHGLVDGDRPMLSSLAVTRDAEDDGFLTALEVLGMEIPADLVVLSACETATGRIYRAEGIVGLTRAFMYAGAPRVLCSLWKVDDEATLALMKRFYETWNPGEGEGLGAAEALRQAQAHVRSQERWSHPFYWAAWTLWGLPDD